MDEDEVYSEDEETQQSKCRSAKPVGGRTKKVLKDVTNEVEEI